MANSSITCIRLLAVASVINLFMICAKGQDVLGVGGFIRSKKNIDFSRIQVELYSQTPGGGLRKVESTDAAPNNGYYFIPVEEVGTYTLRPVAPRGWKIEPEEMVVNIDAKTDNEEFDFEFIGFGITGAVHSRSQTVGPEGISIELVSPESGVQNVLQISKTDEKGQYVFFGVLPGKYFLRIAQEDKTKYDFDTVQHVVDVGEDVGASTPFQIQGFRIKGSISTSNGDVLGNIKFLLKSSGKAIKTVKSDAKGQFTFQNVDNGDYTVTLDSSESIQASLEVQNSEMPVTVEHSHQTVPNFVVKGFALDGSVIASSKTKGPLSGVKIKVTFSGDASELETTTDKMGKFKLNGIRPGHSIKVKAVLDGYDFEAQTLSSLTPSSGIAPIVPARYRLSGRVERESLPSGVEIKVKFTSASPKSSASAGGKVIISEKGTFSIYLPAGKYAVSVELAAEQKGIGFAPVKQEVNVEDGPVSNINFQPIKADLKGKVECLEKQKCSPVQVMLTSTQVSSRKEIEVKGDGTFQFSSVIPSTYKIEVSKDNRCWEKQSQQLDVSSNIDNIMFRQLGYYLTVNSGHSTTLVLSGPNGKTIQEEYVRKGENVICVKTNNIVSLSTKGCEEFEITPSKVNLQDESLPTVNLKAIRYRVSGSVKTKKPISDIGLVAKSDHREEKLTLNRDAGGYSFSFWAYPGEEISFHPSSEEFLFDPEVIHIFVDHTCHVDKVLFEATSGFFLKGQISPPVAGVKIEIKSPKVPNQKQTSTMTNEKGFYKIGPLPGEERYEVSAQKDGYIFEKDTSKAGSFISKKLAAIVVNVNDGELELNGVVVSVSGGKSYRSNTHTKAGIANFLSLSPGEYFVKPQLKEYEFLPKHQLITIKEGETAEVKFKADRVAFSIFGKMVSLNGEAESGITLKAKSHGQNLECQEHSEDATSEPNGEFRFRGLKPGCQYTIALQEGIKNDIEKLMPKETLITMQKKDTHVPNPIVVMRSVEIMDLSLKITDEADAQSEATVKVMVSSPDGGSYSYSGKKIVGELILLPAVPKDDKKYTITIETLPEKFAPKKKATTTFKADAYYKHVSAILPKSSGTTGTTPTKKTSVMFIFMAPLVLIGTVLFLFRDKLPALVEYVNEKIVKNPITSQGLKQGSDLKDSTDSGDDSSSFEMLNVRRKTKKR